jgi:hypothetical protein
MTWWFRFWRRNRLEEQLEKELRFHLDQHASDLIARGLSPAQAKREARIALGGPEQVKQQCREARGTRWVEELLQDTRYALRSFRHRPGFAAITVLISALGIGATTVMFTVINSVLLKPLPFSEPARLVVLHGFLEHLGEFWGFSYPDFKDIHQQSRSLAVAGWTYTGGTISAPGEPQYVDGGGSPRTSSPFWESALSMDAASAQRKTGLVQHRSRSLATTSGSAASPGIAQR